jgi:hypothetical protein
MKRVLIFTVVAALLLTPLDALQVIFNVRTLGTMPWLTPLKFALVGALLGLLSFKLDPCPHPAKIKAVVFHAVCFAIGYISTIVFGEQYHVIAALAVNILFQDLISKYYFRISLIEIVPFFLLLSIAGPLAEWIDVKMGGFDYLSAPNSIPLWLPLLWASGTYLTRSLVGKTRKEPKEYKWIGKLVTFLAPVLRVFAALNYALTYDNIKRLGLIGSFKMAWRLYGFN